MSKRSDVEQAPGNEHNTGWGGKAETKTQRDKGGKVPAIDGTGEHSSGWSEPAGAAANAVEGSSVTPGPEPKISSRGYSSDASDVPGRPRRINDGIKRRS